MDERCCPPPDGRVVRATSPALQQPNSHFFQTWVPAMAPTLTGAVCYNSSENPQTAFELCDTRSQTSSAGCISRLA